jgi:DNA replication protein DnaC
MTVLDSEWKIPAFAAPMISPRPCRTEGCDEPCDWSEAPYPDLCTQHFAEHKERVAEADRERYRERQRRHIEGTLGRLAKNYPRMSNWSFDSYPDDERGNAAKEQAIDWLEQIYDEDARTALYIVGPVGAGKTGLAWSTMRQALDLDCWTVDFHNVRQLLAAARKSYGENTDDPLDGLGNIPFLVLDDLGAERPTEWALEALATLIEERYQRDHYTIVTTNYTPGDLVKRLGHTDPILGQRIVSRLMESAKQIRLDGPDRRLKA